MLNLEEDSHHPAQCHNRDSARYRPTIYRSRDSRCVVAFDFEWADTDVPNAGGAASTLNRTNTGGNQSEFRIFPYHAPHLIRGGGARAQPRGSAAGEECDGDGGGGESHSSSIRMDHGLGTTEARALLVAFLLLSSSFAVPASAFSFLPAHAKVSWVVHVAPRYRLCFSTPHTTPRYVRLRPLPTPFDQRGAPSAHIQYDTGEHTLHATFDVGSGVPLAANSPENGRAGGCRKVDRLDDGRSSRPGPNSSCRPPSAHIAYGTAEYIEGLSAAGVSTSIAQNHPSTSAAASALAANSPQNGREINGVPRMREGRVPSAHTVLNTMRTSTPCVPLDPTLIGEGCTAQARLQGFARLASSFESLPPGFVVPGEEGKPRHGASELGRMEENRQGTQQLQQLTRKKNDRDFLRLLRSQSKLT
ncbi:hypothetical protein C8F04DRAFT_1233780 [Mycena alexandri]|uniref:Uncharacterized protein n=1 Tax=Mycena alexandri TaxID=1745969 RepID=A0AAD6X4L6_9AGAR|nr:hypothetical protein C8F04DRAFT_1233780 [Mycena alexandri]